MAQPGESGVQSQLEADDLVGEIDTAARLGVKRPGVVHDWRRRYADFPSRSPASLSAPCGRGLTSRPGARSTGPL